MTINNLYVTYDEDGTRHHFINDDEVAEDVWTQQHPYLRKGKDNGGTSVGTTGSGNVGNPEVGADEQAESIRAGLRSQRAKAKAERAWGTSHGVGQPETGPEST